jgi:tRNA(Ile)-lysidine synthase
MIERFLSYIESNSLCGTGNRILLTVSGGIDSMVMMDLFLAAGYKTGVAHCNFGLRGEESDEDQRFVESAARISGVECHTRRFQTGKVASEEKLSIQMAARKLRYAWFEEVRGKQGYDFIATAHNQDDVLETFFINLSRGTGIRGLTGIPPRSGKVIRPLLFASRESIREYAESRNLSYREDSSNASDKYLRNRIRHKLLPMLEEQNPAFRKSLMETIDKLSETERIYSEEMEKQKKSLVMHKEGRTLIRIEELGKHPSRNTLLYEILSDFNFGSTAIEDIGKSLGGHPGKQFYSPTHRLVKDREELILIPLKEDQSRKYYLELEEGQIFDPINLEWVIAENNPGFTVPRDPSVACLDLDLLDFPLILRRWQQGDYFRPFGMKGTKKLSDFLIDEKLSLPDKENVWLLASGQKIVWVVGLRIDDRFKITGKSRHVLMIRYSASAL